ncbi:MAG TPA: hypothetical protein VGK60_07635, partial [Pedococcus sp.]
QAEPAPAVQTAQRPAAEQPAAPRRRKRGRVVAPAGPPRHTDGPAERAEEPGSDPLTGGTAGPAPEATAEAY